MSVTASIPGPDGPQAGQKILLPRGVRAMWRKIDLVWVKNDPRRWRNLAMLHLVECCGWSITMCGTAFGIHKGQASREIGDTKKQLAELFDPPLTDCEYGKPRDELSGDPEEFDSPISPTDYE